MSELPQQDTIVQYDADGIEDTYLFAFYVPEEDDIAVYVTLDGEQPIPEDDIKTLDVDYTVAFNIDPVTGGYITFLPGSIPPAGATVTLSRDVQASLNVEFADARNFNGANLDAALQKLLILIQQNKTLINSDQQRALTYRVNAFQATSDIVANTQIPVLEPDQIWKGQGTGVIATTLEEGADTSTLRSDLANASPGTDGARLVGYYDTVNAEQTTVNDFLADIVSFIQTQISAQLFQPGDMKMNGSTTVPTGWLPCDGSAVSRTTYADLFFAVGTNWGVGNGTTTFNVPDFRRRTPVGSGGAGTAILGNTVGNTGGEEAHSQTAAEMAAHDHAGSTMNGVNGAGTAQPWDAAIGTVTSVQGQISGVQVASNGSGDPANVIQPSAIVLMMIKY